MNYVLSGNDWHLQKRWHSPWDTVFDRVDRGPLQVEGPGAQMFSMGFESSDTDDVT